MKINYINNNYIIFLTLCLVSLPSIAATEVIPFSGYRISGEFTELNTGVSLDVDDSNTQGFIINKDYEADSQLEFIYNKQSSVLRAAGPVSPNAVFDIDIEYFHIGGIVLKPIDKSSDSFFGAGIGITHFSPDFSGYGSKSEWSLSLTGGIKRRITEHLGFRIGFQFYGTPVNKNTAIFCSNGSCDIRFKSNLYTQYETNIGLILRF